MSFVLGVDENGLGPVMGPLVVTGVLMGGIPATWLPGAADSKKFFLSGAPQSLRKLEVFCLSLFQALYGYLPGEAASFIRAVAPEACCPTGTNLCWSRLNHAFSSTCAEEIFEASCNLKNWMEKEGVSFNGLHCQIVCPARLNTLITRGDSKSFIDFSCFAQVIRHLAVPGVKIQAGKIGGTKNYLTWLRYAFPEATIKPLEESHGLSSYQVSLSGKTYNLEFWVDVEEKSLAAAVASLIGKFVRELFMESINKALDNQVPVSGYRDRKTKVFLSRILPRLPEKKIPVSCLVRKA